MEFVGDANNRPLRQEMRSRKQAGKQHHFTRHSKRETEKMRERKRERERWRESRHCCGRLSLDRIRALLRYEKNQRRNRRRRKIRRRRMRRRNRSASAADVAVRVARRVIVQSSIGGARCDKWRAHIPNQRETCDFVQNSDGPNPYGGSHSKKDLFFCGEITLQ